MPGGRNADLPTYLIVCNNVIIYDDSAILLDVDTDYMLTHSSQASEICK